jgi:putative membrane protein
VAGTALYARGLKRLRSAVGPGRGLPSWRVGAFAGGILTLVAALASPLDALAGVLFSAHMGQHLLLILVAAPLLIAGNPVLAALWALPRPTRARVLHGWRRSALRSAWRWLAAPVAAWILHALALLAWHTPALFDAALRHESLHALEHASFLGTALLFWWPIVHPAGRRQLGPGAAVVYVFGMFLLGGGLGALLTFAPVVLYAYGPGVAAWGLSRLEDQQLAGLIMWIPGGAIYVAAVVVLVMRWFRADDRRVQAAGEARIFAPELGG